MYLYRITFASGYNIPIRGAKVLIFLFSAHMFSMKFVVSQINLHIPLLADTFA